MPSSRKGSEINQTIGHSTSASSAIGQQSTNSNNQPTSARKEPIVPSVRRNPTGPHRSAAERPSQRESLGVFPRRRRAADNRGESHDADAISAKEGQVKLSVRHSALLAVLALYWSHDADA